MCSWLRRAAVDWGSLMFWSGQVMFCNSLWGGRRETINRIWDWEQAGRPIWPLLTGASWLHKHALRLIQKHLPFKYSWQICLFNQAAVKHRWHFTKVKNCFFKLKVKWAHQKHAWNSRQWGYFTCTLTLSSSWGSLCANYSTKRNFVRTNAQTWIGVLSQNLMLTYYYILFLMVKKNQPPQSSQILTSRWQQNIRLESQPCQLLSLLS